MSTEEHIVNVILIENLIQMTSRHLMPERHEIQFKDDMKIDSSMTLPRYSAKIISIQIELAEFDPTKSFS